MDTRWPTPFTCMICGPTQSGKTYFTFKFIKNIKNLTNPPPQKILFFYTQWQEAYRGVKDVEFIEGLPPENLDTGGVRSLVILDDLMNQTNSNITNLFIKGSHHNNISIMYLVQNIFNKNKDHRTISLNCHYLVLFKNPRDLTQIQNLAKQMFPGKSKHMMESYKDACGISHGYLLADLRQDTPDHLRLRTSIFPDEYQVVYLQK